MDNQKPTDDMPDVSKIPAMKVAPPARPRSPSGGTIADEGSIQEHGRTYTHYNTEAYSLPNDGDEQIRLDLQHHMVRLMLDGALYKAPLQKPSRVLDVGTGTGIWAIEFAQENPRSEVIGSDLSLIQPSGMSPNVSFVREDAEATEWTIGRSFSFIHTRAFIGFLKDAKAFLRRVYDHLEPGGWIELQEPCHELFPGKDESIDHSAAKTLLSSFAVIAAKSGRDPYIMPHLKTILAEIGFVEVDEVIEHAPIGDWPDDPKLKEVGKWAGADAEKSLGADGLAGMMIKPLIMSGMTEEQVAYLTSQARKEVRGETEPRVYMMGRWHFVFGRKPLRK